MGAERVDVVYRETYPDARIKAGFDDKSRVSVTSAK